ncbi:MAG: helix-turn-helix domain-containing protein [Desulfovibrionaceae bacterium]
MDTESRQEQIARAALKIAENGIRAVTVSRVSEAVGMVPSALYRHFRNKDEILKAAFGLLRNMLLANLEHAALAQDSLVGLERFWRRHLAVIREYKAVPRILFSDDIASDQSPIRPLLVQGQDDMIQGLSSIMALGQKSGTIRNDVPARDLSILFLGQMLLPAYMHFLRRGEFDLEGHVERNWNIFRQTLTQHLLQTEDPACANK